GIVPVRIEELDALLLAERTPCERDVSAPRERSEHLLPGEMRFPAHLMPQREQDRGVRSRTALRQVEICGHEEARLALENNFLYPVALTIKRAGDTRVERRSLRKPTDGFDDVGAHQFSARGKIVERGNLRHRFRALPQMPIRFLRQASRKHLADIVK